MQGGHGIGGVVDVGRGDVLVAEAGLFQGNGQQVLGVPAAAGGHALALEVLHAGQVVLLAHYQADAAWVGLLGGQVHHRLACGLGEHRGCVGGMAEVDGAGAQGFEQLRAGGELVPADFHALRCQGLLQGAAAFEDVDAVELLVTDAQGPGFVGQGLGPGQQGTGDTGQQAADQQAAQGGEGTGGHGHCSLNWKGNDVPRLRRWRLAFNFYIPVC
ncbi:hypothetical protein D3C76_289260 [compost metagenome]